MTRAQKAVLDFITTFIEANGISPSFDEIKEYLGLNSKSSVYRIVRSLEEQGRIFYRPRRARSILLPHQVPAQVPQADLASIEFAIRSYRRGTLPAATALESIAVSVARMRGAA